MTTPSSSRPGADWGETCRRLHSLPDAMRERKQWLLWRYEKDPKRGPKPLKVPYYVSGYKRRGVQGSDEDRQALAAFELALQLLERGKYDGLGFAFLPGDGLVGVDIDGAIDPDTGEVSAMCLEVIAECASYTEYSPSGKGVHIITAGQCKTFKSDDIGLEVFSGAQYFTCTGRRWPGTPDQVQPISEDALASLRARIDAAREARAAAAPKPPRAKASAPAAPARDGGTDDFKAVNTAAMGAMDAWVPMLLPKARWHAGSATWRVTSKDLGRDLQEDLSLRHDGIQDFGTRKGLTPVDVCVEFGGMTPKDALAWLAERLGMPLHPKPRRADAGRQGPPPDDDLPPPLDRDGVPATEGAKSGASTPDTGEGGGKRKKKPPKNPVDFDVVEDLREHFALIYSTDTAFDGRTGKILKINAMRLAFGADEVKLWLAFRARRRMVLPEQLMFEPGRKLKDPCINLWRGLPTKPRQGNVAPILELLHHLCGESGANAEEIARNMAWTLRWLALPLQRPGTKMRSALVFHGPQGAGKNLLFEIMCKIYGQYALVVGQDQLEDKFNDWASQKLFLIGDEVVARAELFHQKNKLKSFITGETIQINTKMLPLRTEANHVNVVFLSNEAQPLALEPGDRRFFVIWTPARREDDLYRRVADCLDAGGAAAFLQYLLDVELNGFTEYDIPPMTTAKQDLIDLGLKPHERFARELLGGYLPLPLQVCSTEQLYRAFCTWVMRTGERFPPPQEAFSKGIAKAAAGKLHLKPVKLPVAVNGKQMLRVWIPDGAGPVEDQTLGAWAGESVAAFESVLTSYSDEMSPMRRGEKS